MSARYAALPSTEGLGLTVSAVISVGFVLASAAPYVRARRDVQRTWTDAATATKDCVAKLERLQASRDAAQKSLEAVGTLEPNTAVAQLRGVRRAVEKLFEDFELAVLSVETFKKKIKALNRYRDFFIQLRPDFDEKMISLKSVDGQIAALSKSAEQIRSQNMLAEFDQALDLTVTSATAYALQRARAIAAREGERTTSEAAIAALKKVHDFAKAHGVKLSA